MARPYKEGLDYFSIDVDIVNDDKIKLIKAKHGLVGFAIVVLLLTKIYKEGYYYPWSEDEIYLFADEARVDINTVTAIVNDCINRGFFNQELYNKYGILTSRGIQKRYLHGCTRRKKLVLIREYFIADDHLEVVFDNKDKKAKVVVTFKSINVSNNFVNADLASTETPQIEIEREREKESKGKDNARAEIITQIQKIKPISDSNDGDFVNDLIDNYPRDWLLEAIKKAIAQKARKYEYVDTIVQNWRLGGYKDTDKPWEVDIRGKPISKATPRARNQGKSYSEYNNFEHG